MERRKEETPTIENNAAARAVIRDSRSPAQALIGSLQEKLGETQDRYDRQYFEGLASISALKAVHNRLVSLAHDKASKEPAYETILGDYEGKPHTALDELTTKVKPSTETRLTEKGLARAQAELKVHQDRAGSNELLELRYHELGKRDLSQAYQDRARLDNATRRGLARVVTAYETKLKTLEVEKSQAQSLLPSLREAGRALERARLHLEDSHKAHQQVRAATREEVETRKTITRLQTESSDRTLTPTEQKVFKQAQLDKVARAAEGQALNAVASYRQYHQNVKAAEQTCEAFSRALTGQGLELAAAESERSVPLEGTEQNTTLERGNGDFEGPGRGRQELHVTHSAIQEPELRKPAVSLAKGDHARQPVGRVVQQTLKQIDHEL